MRRSVNVSAIVLAAGFSSRMADFKPLLPLGKETILEHCVRCFRRAGVSDIIVVTGHRADALVPLLKRLGARDAYNDKFADGMFSSVKTGIRSLPVGVEAFFLLPVDIPLVRSQSIRQLTNTYQVTNALVTYPLFGSERGHPPLISARLVPDILSMAGPGGLREILRCYEQEALDVEVIDQGVLLDMDQPEDYQRVMRHYAQRHVPTERELSAMLRMANTGACVISHCQVVAKVGRIIARALTGTEIHLDADLIHAAGLLHDIAKGVPQHAEAAAGWLRRLGFSRLARIVGTHMELNFCESRLDEAAVLFLADKLVCHDRVVSLAERFRQSVERFSGDDSVFPFVLQRFETAKRIQAKVETVLGQSLQTVIAEACSGGEGYDG